LTKDCLKITVGFADQSIEGRLKAAFATPANEEEEHGRAETRTVLTVRGSVLFTRR
jgi:hypothetical protein